LRFVWIREDREVPSAIDRDRSEFNQ